MAPRRRGEWRPGEVAAGTSSTLTASTQFSSIHHKDAFLLLRALCKLSNKPQSTDPNMPPDPYALQNKLLSLEMRSRSSSARALRSLVGQVSIFIKQYLTVAGAGLSSGARRDTLAAHLRLLVAHFKNQLKDEIGVLLDTMFLDLLGHNYTYEHRMPIRKVFQIRRTLRSHRAISSTTTAANSSNLYQRIVSRSRSSPWRGRQQHQRAADLTLDRRAGR